LLFAHFVSRVLVRNASCASPCQAARPDRYRERLLAEREHAVSALRPDLDAALQRHTQERDAFAAVQRAEQVMRTLSGEHESDQDVRAPDEREGDAACRAAG
jgi:hypothetical protein